MAAEKYHVEIRDARGVVIGDGNVVYQYFLPENYRPLAEHFISFDDLIAEWTKDFVGREFVDARLAAFLESHDRGYFVLEGEPGIGKTAWAAHLVTERRCLHHFNVAAMGIVRPDQCLENLCAQIIARYQLGVTYLPLTAGKDGGYLDHLLRQASERLNGQKLVIVIDAVDEVQMPGGSVANVLYLPPSLPQGVYFVLTRRPQPVLLETAPGTRLEPFALHADMPENQADLRAYLRWQTEKPEIAARLDERDIAPACFVEELVERSGGNFMYLAYLLPDIAAGEYDPLALGRLPRGLRGYYQRFWRELEEAKGEGREAWTKFCKPVIGLLAAAGEPVSAAWMGRVLGLDAEEVEDFSLTRWRKFLYRMPVDGEVLWRVYHASFQDFLSEQLDGARRYHAQIAEYYRQRYGGNWCACDEGYAFRHLTAHLSAAGEREALFQLVEDPDWYAASRAYDLSRRSYALDVERAVGAAEREGVDGLPEVVGYSLLYATLGSLGTEIPPEALEAMARLGGVEQALGYAALMVEPEKQAKAYRLIGLVLWEQGKEQQARRALARALAAAEGIKDGEDKATALSKVAQALAQVRDKTELSHALTVAERIEWAGYKASALSSVAQALAGVGEREQAQLTLAHALAAIGGIKSPWNKVKALSAVVQALAQVGDKTELSRALTAAEGIDDEKYKAEALSAVAQALAQIGEQGQARQVLTRALAVAEGIGDEKYKAEALSAVAQALAQIGEQEQGRQVLARALTVTKGIRGEEDKATVLRKVAQALARVGDKARLTRAQVVAERMEYEWNRAKALSGMAWALVRMGDKAGLARVLDAAEGIEDKVYKAQVLGVVAQALAQIGELERALAVVEGIENKVRKAQVLGAVAQALAQVGELERGLVVAEGIDDEEYKASALSSVAQALAQMGEQEQAWQVLAHALAVTEGIVDYEGRGKAKAVSSVARALAEVGDREGLARALAVAERIKWAWYKASALSGVAQALAQVGEQEQARQVLARALTAAKGIELPWVQVEALNDVAQALAQIGEQEQTWQVLTRALATVERIEQACSLSGGEPRVLTQVRDGAEMTLVLSIEGIEWAWSKTEALSGVVQTLVPR